MKIPIRFKKLDCDKIEDVQRYLVVFGKVLSIGETEKHTIFFLNPSNISSIEENLKILKQTLKMVGYKGDLIDD
ncbi:hypothetical protein [Acinetobacter baumannii]|uniref:hypothetical protein n=1 Tax=Acinetobacter baumannii TaxID=470 RepID=UPI002957DA6D|nr:hypothetical protein [Acinetobacter baumannii]